MQYCEKKNLKPEKQLLHRQIFNELSFHTPVNDTYAKGDRFYLKLQGYDNK